MSAHWSKWSKVTRQTWWKDSEEGKVAFWWSIYLYKGGGTEWELREEPALSQSCLEGRIGTFGNCGAARSWRLFLESRGRWQWQGVQRKPGAFGWHGVEGRKLTAVEPGKEVVVVAQVWAWALDLDGGAQVFEMQVFTGVGTAQLEVATVGLFCSILSTLRLPRPLVVQHMLRNYPKLHLIWSAYSNLHPPTPLVFYVLCIYSSCCFLYSFTSFLNLHHFLCPLLCPFWFPLSFH